MDIMGLRLIKCLFREGLMYFKISAACNLKRKGYSNAQIAQKMGCAESTVRNYLCRGGMIHGR